MKIENDRKAQELIELLKEIKRYRGSKSHDWWSGSSRATFDDRVTYTLMPRLQRLGFETTENAWEALLEFYMTGKCPNCGGRVRCENCRYYEMRN